MSQKQKQKSSAICGNWMEPEDILLSEISQAQIQMLHLLLCTWKLKRSSQWLKW
jgi:hypothetical protein